MILNIYLLWIILFNLIIEYLKSIILCDSIQCIGNILMEWVLIIFYAAILLASIKSLFF